MKRCFNCERTINFWQLRCGICRNWSWRLPHIALFVVAFSVLFGGIILTLEYLADSARLPASAAQNNQVVPESQPDPFKYRRRYRGTSIGKP